MYREMGITYWRHSAQGEYFGRPLCTIVCRGHERPE
jgi:hypothetical protein